jgi:hypothetical protein
LESVATPKNISVSSPAGELQNTRRPVVRCRQEDTQGKFNRSP